MCERLPIQRHKRRVRRFSDSRERNEDRTRRAEATSSYREGALDAKAFYAISENKVDFPNCQDGFFFFVLMLKISMDRIFGYVRGLHDRIEDSFSKCLQNIKCYDLHICRQI